MYQYKTLFYELIFSLTLCDHMGDVCDRITLALRKAGDFFEWEDLDKLRDILEKRGINTISR